jgi:hypothetical protein
LFLLSSYRKQFTVLAQSNKKWRNNNNKNNIWATSCQNGAHSESRKPDAPFRHITYAFSGLLLVLLSIEVQRFDLDHERLGSFHVEHDHEGVTVRLHPAVAQWQPRVSSACPSKCFWTMTRILCQRSTLEFKPFVFFLRWYAIVLQARSRNESIANNSTSRSTMQNSVSDNFGCRYDVLMALTVQMSVFLAVAP